MSVTTETGRGGLAIAAVAAAFVLASPTARAEAQPAARTTPSQAPLSIDMPIGQLAKDPGGRAVLEKALPGLTSHPEYPLFKFMSLKQLSAVSGGRLSPADLREVEEDLLELVPADRSQK